MNSPTKKNGCKDEPKYIEIHNTLIGTVYINDRYT